MTYNQKTYKKCNFVKLAKDPLKPLAKPKKQKVDYNYKGRTLKEWRDYLIELHSLDTDKSNLINLTLLELCIYYEWEIHNCNEQFVDLHTLEVK